MNGKDILFLSTNRYDAYFPSRKTRFAKFLSENDFRVVYVESPYTYLAYLKKGVKSDNAGKLEHISDNFYILRSFPIWPFFKKYNLFNRLDEGIYYSKITNTLKEISFEPYILFNYMPFFPKGIKQFNAKLIYDCVDDHASFGGLINPAFVNTLEKKTVELADVVMVTDNEVLTNKIKSFGKTPVVVGNGVNYELFSQWLKNKDSLQIKKQITYVGAIADWFDVDLVYKVATAFKDFEIILIGFVSTDISQLQGLSNVKFLGKKTQEEFAPILSESSVAIVPFKVNELTKKVDPLKIYEYLSAGVPVVSTPVGNVSKFPVYIGITSEEFIQKIRIAISEDSIDGRVKRTVDAKVYSWENKFKAVLEIVENLSNG